MGNAIEHALTHALIERGHLTKEALESLVTKAAQSGGELIPFLIQQGAVSEDVIQTVLSEEFKIPQVDLSKTEVQKEAIQKVPLKFAEYYHILPIQFDGSKLVVAVSSPLDIRNQDDISTQLGCTIETVLARSQEISDLTKQYYGLGAGTIEKIIKTDEAKDQGGEDAEVEASGKVEDLEKMAEDASVIKFVNQILMDAFKKRATDIHIEPYRDRVKVRYRIDGVLVNTNVPPEIKRFILPIVSRIKIMANMNIIEKRLPQDGRAIIKIGADALDLRISSIPTPSGESIVIRLLPTTRLFSLEKLGLDKQENKVFNRLVEKPHGVILITGPTGSGKSTTLYACLSMINTDERKIITIEDPVEYEMEGITQIQVISGIGLTFGAGLRSILRHDPDVIMVGEIRDLETAEIAARVALTGHLVFSTLHTNDAASGVTRLVDIGVPPYLVSSSVEAFIAQRLVRTLCKHCKVEDKDASDQVKAIIARELGLPSLTSVKIYKGKGCKECNSTGFWGRIAIFEILLLDEHLRDMIMKQAPTTDIKEYAVSKGMRTLRQCGWQKVIAGLTTPDEIFEVAPLDVTMAEEEGPSPVGGGTSPSVSPLGKKKAADEERRAFVRLDIRVNVKFRVLNRNEAAKWKNATEKFSITKNISAGGLVFNAKDQLPIGSFLELQLELPDRKDAVDCVSRVLRVTEGEAEESFDVAVNFLDLSSADRKRIDEFVKEEVF